MGKAQGKVKQKSSKNNTIIWHPLSGPVQASPEKLAARHPDLQAQVRLVDLAWGPDRPGALQEHYLGEQRQPFLLIQVVDPLAVH
jgi:hypothetical protein